MRRFIMATMVALFPVCAQADEPKRNQDYAVFSRLVHKFVVQNLPKQFEENSGWGQTIGIPADIKLAGLRKITKVGDRLTAPNGAWRRFDGKVEDPDKNLKIIVKDVKRLEGLNLRLTADVEVKVACH